MQGAYMVTKDKKITENKEINKTRKSSKNAPNKYKKILIISAIILAVAIIGVAIFILIPKNNISIKGAEVTDTSTSDGVKIIKAKLSVDCNASEENGYYQCEPRKIEGNYSGSDKIGITNVNVKDLATNDNKISFDASRVSFKKVVVREEKISSHSDAYVIVMRDKETDKEIIRYELELVTNLTDQDSAKINAEPNKESIAAALKTIDTIRETCILNEDTDPNNSLGKDGEYYIKVSYIDNRVDTKYYGDLDSNLNFVITETSCAESGSDAGGTIEVFRTVEDAKRRKEYLDGFSGVLSAGKSKLINTTLVRVSPNLKASEQNDLLEKIYQTLSK